MFPYQYHTYIRFSRERKSEGEKEGKKNVISKRQSICSDAGISQVHRRRILPCSVTTSRLVFWDHSQLRRHPSAAYSPAAQANRGKHSLAISFITLLLLSFFHPLSCLFPCTIAQPVALLNNSRHLIRQLRQSRRTLRAQWRQQSKGKRASLVATEQCVSDRTVLAHPHQPRTLFVSS